MLKKLEEKISVDAGDGSGLKQHHIYEKKVVTKIRISKITLIQRKKDLEEELAQINLDLSQINEDEKTPEE